MFQRSHDYSAQRDSGITVPITLAAGGKSVRLHAKLDTGASVCIFERAYGEELGLDIEHGRLVHVRTPNSGFKVYGHDVTIVCFDWNSIHSSSSLPLPRFNGTCWGDRAGCSNFV
jgi:hypothetical protein